MSEWFYKERDEIVAHLRSGKTIEFHEPNRPHIKLRWRIVTRLVRRDPDEVHEVTYRGDEVLLEETRRLNPHELRNRLQVGWTWRVVE
jgi:hypothetical protein